MTRRDRFKSVGLLCGSSLRAVLVSVCALLLVPAIGQAEPSVDFARDVLPILSDKCFVCHGPDAEDDEILRLDSYAGATADLGGYRAVDAENPTESELLARISSGDDPMPPPDAEKQLTDAERAVLQRWIRGGGEYAEHWAFVRPEKRLPEGVDLDGNMIDAYVAAEHQQRGVNFAPRAERATLARRASLVLCGLPPEPEQLASFLADERPDAYERFVDQLLADPRYGEQQARHWLDAVRYGDTHGLHLDNRRGIYPYRDWVVLSLNSNLPLDDFITWQLAGDLLSNPTLQQLVATGFVRMNPTTGEGGAISEEYQAKNNFDRTENLGSVLLGMTLTCARCHTHKYDPIPQTEYYRLLAFFNSTAEPALDANKYDYGPTVQAPGDQQQWSAWMELERRRDAMLASVDTQLDRLEDLPAPAAQQARAWRAANATDQLKILADPDGPFATAPPHQAAAKLAKEIATAREDFVSTLVARDLPEPRPTHVLRRGEYNQPQDEPLQPGVPSVMGSLPESAPRNRLGLAEWLTSPDHPLVARVLINRVWQQTFGHGLVRTPEDFGLQGEQPTHPRLLDWLAVELQESGWDLKHMLRMMVTSRTFQQSSARRDDVEDPENRLWARGPSYRLDAEVIRDLGLWASGLLDAHMGGEGVKPYQPAGLWKALAHPASNTKEYQRDKGPLLYRRSLYLYWKRTSPHPMMILFDAPDRESSCVRRSRTSTPLQSLALLNETQRVEIGRSFAERLLREVSDDDERFNRLYRLLACREPNEQEMAACTDLLQKMRERYADDQDAAASLLSIGDAARDAALDVQEHAAWTQVALTVLASDLALLLY